MSYSTVFRPNFVGSLKHRTQILDAKLQSILEAGNEGELHIDVSSFLPISLDMRKNLKSHRPAH